MSDLCQMWIRCNDAASDLSQMWIRCNDAASDLCQIWNRDLTWHDVAIINGNPTMHRAHWHWTSFAPSKSLACKRLELQPLYQTNVAAAVPNQCGSAEITNWRSEVRYQVSHSLWSDEVSHDQWYTLQVAQKHSWCWQ